MRRWIITTLVCSLSACAFIQDQGELPPSQINPEQIRLAESIHLARDGWPEARWWVNYGDEQLNMLMDFALHHAPDMAVARTRIAQARAQVQLVSGSSAPQIGTMAAINRERVSASGFLGPYAENIPARGLTGPWYSEGIAGLVGHYQFDLWGEEHSRISAALGVQNAKLAEASAVELEITATTAQIYFAIQTLQHKSKLLREAQLIQSDVVASHQAHVDRGLESITPLAEANTLQRQTTQQITAAETQRQQLFETLRALIGALPDDMPELQSSPLPSTRTGVPEVLSYQLLSRRPDLQAMRWYLQSSLDQVGAAKAAFYPSFDIKAFFGFDALHLKDIWLTRSKQVNLIPGLSLPLFDGGLLNANLNRARATNYLLIEQYNQAVLNAVRDVAVSGTRLQGWQQQVALQEERVEQAQISNHSAEAYFERGIFSKIKSKETLLPVIQQQVELIELQGRQLSESVALIKALGGGYNIPPNATEH